jgi:drug/metabolite transporter (DMT)-like permease
VVNLALLAVGAAAICSGGAAVLQASAVRRLPTASAVNARFVVRLARSPRYLMALALVVAGFGSSMLALRSLPLFVVQAGRASSLAVTAVLAILTLHVRLRRHEVIAVIGIVGGLLALALASGPQSAAEVGTAARVALLGAALLAGLAAAAALRVRPVSRSGVLLAVLAGICFGLLAVGARVVRGFAVPALLADPAAWAMAAAGALGLLLGAAALQRARVVTVTGAMVATETVLGAGLGVLLCGDRPEPGSTPAALAGFALVLAGALLLARFGAPAPDAQGHEEPATLPIA